MRLISLVAATVLLALLPRGVLAQIEQQPALREMERQEKARQQQAPRLTKSPKLIHQVPPPYPEAAKQERRQGTVVLRITIDEEGYVSRVDVLQSAGADLDDAAMGAVSQFVFEPAEVDDVPAPIQVDFKQAFVLKEEVKQVDIEPSPVTEEEALEERPKEPTGPATSEVETAPVREGKLNYLGLVRESGTKAPLADAEIYIVVAGSDEEISTTTGKDGRFELRGVPPGEHMVRVTATGYEQMATIEQFSETQAVKAIYYLPRRSYNKFETVVRSKRPQKEVSRISLTREEVSQVPGTFGDPIRVIENLPGMARAPLLGGALLVRGANPADTGVFMDGVPIPLLYHFLALTSVVNAEFLESIDFYPGGFGARYGRATAGIVDVKSRDLKLRSCRGTAKVDIMDSGFFFGCPVTLWGPEVDSDAPNWRRVTFAAAARRSWLDAVVPLATALFLPPGAGSITVAPVYWDYQAKMEYRPLAAHTLSLFAFGSDDTLRVLTTGNADRSGFGLRTEQTFHRLMGSWEWRITPNLSNRLAPWVGYEGQEAGFGAGGALNGAFGVNIRSYGFRNDLKWRLFEGLNLNSGLDATGGTFAFAAVLPFSTEINAFPRIFPRVQGNGIEASASGHGNAWGAYVETEIGPFAGIKLIPGFRADLFELEKVYNVTASPRMTARWEVLPGTTLKAAYGVYEKMSPPETRIQNLGNPRLYPERSRHHIVGVEQKLTDKLRLDFQLFYNRRNNLTVSSNRILAVSGGIADVETYSNDGVGNAYGAELLLRHDLSKNFFGWIAYTLMRSEVKDHPKQNWIPSQYDQTHILTVVGQYKLPWHLPFREWSRTGRLPRGIMWNTGWAILSGDWSVGARFRMVTGNPDTTYVSATHDLDRDSFVAKSGDPRGTRLPTFHQLDIRVDYKMAFDSFLVAVYLDAINTYNRQNAEITTWDYRYRDSAPLALLPFLPIVGFNAEF